MRIYLVVCEEGGSGVFGHPLSDFGAKKKKEKKSGLDEFSTDPFRATVGWVRSKQVKSPVVFFFFLMWSRVHITNNRWPRVFAFVTSRLYIYILMVWDELEWMCQ